MDVQYAIISIYELHVTKQKNNTTAKDGVKKNVESNISQREFRFQKLGGQSTPSLVKSMKKYAQTTHNTSSGRENLSTLILKGFP